jgi:hypothetical protein
MALPTAYTEQTIKEYMQTILGKTGVKLGLSVEGDNFDEAAHEVLFFLGESSYSFATSQDQIKKVRAVARQEAWRSAMNETVHEASHSVGAPGTGQTTRADIHRHSKEMFEAAVSEVAQAYPELVSESGSWSVGRVPVNYDGDYYKNAGETA